MSGPFTYSVFSIDLTTAGEQRLSQEAGYLLFQEARDVSGVVQLDAYVSLRVDKYQQVDPIRFRPNHRIEGYFQDIIIAWPAQPGWTATFFLARGRAENYENLPLRLEAPPTKQIITGGAAGNLAHAQYSVGTGAIVLLAASRSSRQSVELTFDADLWIGNSGLTSGNGFKVLGPGTWGSEKFAGALYGLAVTGTVAVQVMEAY